MNYFPTFKDQRGSFTPLNLSIKPETVDKWNQVNISINDKRGTFRGMHYQSRHPQQKYVKVIQGSIIDYLYNLQTHKVEAYYLSAHNQKTELFVPKEFAHGFLTLEDNTIVTYLTEGIYDPEFEHSIPYTTIPEIADSVFKTFPNPTDIIINQKDREGK